MMWPFSRKKKAAEAEAASHAPLAAIVEKADEARNERSETVTAFLRRMKQIELELDRDLTGRRGNGAAD